MSRKTQVKKGLAIKTALWQRGQTIQALAIQLGHRRSTLSRAINQNCFPKVRAKIERELGL